MSKKTIGHIELTWICPNCETRNGGLIKYCVNCGSPQPKDVEFILDKDAKQVNPQQPRSGADIHCPYCQTRNHANATVCSSCGGDLVGGIKRASGKVLTEKDVLTCPECGFKNPKGTAVCEKCGVPFSSVAPSLPPTTLTHKQSGPRPWMFLPVIAILLLACSLIWLLFFKTSPVYGTVQSVNWETTTNVEVFTTVTRQDWRDEVPTDGVISSCELRSAGLQDQPAPNSKEICSTEIIDAGDGTGTIEETCVYEVFADYCSYNIDVWVSADPLVQTGVGTQVLSELPILNADERYGTSETKYSIYFDTNQGVLVYSTDDQNYYSNFSVGTEWMLSVNNLGGIVEISR